ncbi:MAG TPA: DUF2585 family protein [Pyrinomonadaceae bacterium]|jgi:hypothetical protein|nr:DUF2585 family protein [Pyrinomonadaceae bacterium]
MTTESNRVSVLQIAVVGLILLLVVVLLRAEGRLFLCDCRHFAIWTSDTCSSQTSQQLFDPYSFTHVLHGFLFFWLISLLFRRLTATWQVWLALMLEGAWEVFENTHFVIDKYRTETAALGYTGDTIVNSLGDLTCALAGFLLARKLGLRWSLIVFVLIEIGLTLLIHDSLLLQILMLVHPVEAIKLWQTCVQP